MWIWWGTTSSTRHSCNTVYMLKKHSTLFYESSSIRPRFYLVLGKQQKLGCHSSGFYIIRRIKTMGLWESWLAARHSSLIMTKKEWTLRDFLVVIAGWKKWCYGTLGDFVQIRLFTPVLWRLCTDPVVYPVGAEFVMSIDTSNICPSTS